MDKYEWQRNKAVVDRLYYSERTVQTTVFFAGAYTLTNLFFMRQNYFSNLMRSRILPIWGYTLGFNAVILFILLKPLRQEEIRSQWDKRMKMGKWLYSLYHLEDVYTPKKTDEKH